PTRPRRDIAMASRSSGRSGMDEFEARLRTFKPRKPGPLPHTATPRRAGWLLAAAAVVAAAAAVTLVGRNVGSSNSGAVQDSGTGVVRGFSPARNAVPTVGSLTSLALNDPAALDAELNRMSQALLPDVEQPDHALSALGRNSQ